VWVVATNQAGGQDYGPSSWPVTSQLLSIDAIFASVLSQALLFVLGEAVWRERETGMDSLIDATGAPSWVFFLGKLLAMIITAALALVVLMLANAVTQVILGPVETDFGLLLLKLFSLELPRSALLLVPVLLIHTLVNNKCVGHFVSLLVVAVVLLLPRLPLEWTAHIWAFGYTPSPIYSDMNGYGLLTGVRWYQA
jgi:ABC-2 type transport system permease protein